MYPQNPEPTNKQEIPRKNPCVNRHCRHHFPPSVITHYISPMAAETAAHTVINPASAVPSCFIAALVLEAEEAALVVVEPDGGAEALDALEAAEPDVLTVTDTDVEVEVADNELPVERGEVTVTEVLVVMETDPEAAELATVEKLKPELLPLALGKTDGGIGKEVDAVLRRSRDELWYAGV
ncbi:hypothetical protein BDQ17DRAFT_257362 [Cyathus striatus]|nr:hypothetical protein BDQ17DRAFT_257362 [Cyathus striatus]